MHMRKYIYSHFVSCDKYIHVHIYTLYSNNVIIIMINIILIKWEYK